jgi:OmpA-OmpF porin, OOP family
MNLNLTFQLKMRKMKKILLLLVAALFSVVCLAQEKEKALKQYSFGDNWFIQGQGGVSYSFFENNGEKTVFNLLAPHAALSIGKYFSPQAGTRLQLGGWESRTYLNSNNKYFVKFYSANIDGLLNLTNVFLKYKENRVFNLIGILGLGYVHTFRNGNYNIDKDDYWVPRVGLQTDFRLSNALNFNIETNLNIADDNFNGIRSGEKYDCYLNILAGLTYKFNNRGFALVDIMDPALIQSLNDEINRLRGQVAEYKECCEKKQVPETIIKEVPVVKEAPWNAVILFRLDKSVIDPNQEANLYNVAKYLKENPDAKVTIASYCDVKTGTPEYNQNLSERRSAAVVKALTKSYGITSDRFNIINNGDKMQPYPDNNSWNRVVIFKSN